MYSRMRACRSLSSWFKSCYLVCCCDVLRRIRGGAHRSRESAKRQTDVRRTLDRRTTVCLSWFSERMYAIETRQQRAGRWHLRDTPLWRVRWALVAAVVAALLGAGYARVAEGSSAGSGPVPVAAESVTVAPGDTLWD